MSTSSANSAASPAVSGLDYDDTALTLALPGSSSSTADPTAAADRKRAHADHYKPPSPK
jgi:auxin-responsive protein IAA